MDAAQWRLVNESRARLCHRLFPFVFCYIVRGRLCYTVAHGLINKTAKSGNGGS